MNDSRRLQGPFSAFHTWLSPRQAPCPADLIFVLAGGMHRKEFALELFRENFAPRILFSVGRFEIRRFSKMPLPVPLDLLQLAQELPPPQRHYFAYFEGKNVEVEHVPPKRFGTLTEVQSFARWLDRRPEFRSALIVSSGSHLRRIRMCCRALLPPSFKSSFVAVASKPNGSDSASDSLERTSALCDLRELLKILTYWGLLRFRGK